MNLTSSKRCLITGATGLVGRHLIKELHDDYDISAIVRQETDTYKSLPDDVFPVFVDLTTNVDTKILPGKVDSVIYLAQSQHFREFPDKAIEIFDVNTLNVVRLLDYARTVGAKTFVYASSGGVYGNQENRMSEEIEIPASAELGFYSSTKLCSEILLQNYTNIMNIIILRFFFVYGPGQKRTMLLPRLVDNVKNGKEIVLQGSNGISINPIYVEDAARAIARSLELKGSHKINVGGPEVLTLRQIGEIIGRGVNKNPIFKEDPGAKVNNFIADIVKMREMLVPPRVRFTEGVKSIL